MQFVSLSDVRLRLGENFCGHRADVTHIDQADLSVAGRGVEGALGADAGGEVGHDILQKAVGPQDGVRETGIPQFLFNCKMPARK
jgi:hypothetical protein